MNDNTPSLRVAIVDDHPMFRLGLAAAIEEMDGIELVAKRALIRWPRCRGAQPDVLLPDVACRCLRSRGQPVLRAPPRYGVMPRCRKSATMLALRDGASGYLIQGAGPERVEHAIRTVASGDVVLDQSLAQGVTELAQVRRGANRRPFPQLTSREFDILQLLAEGLDNATIARRLFLSPKTVRNHVSNVFSKIEAPDRPGAIVLAHRQGLGT